MEINRIEKQDIPDREVQSPELERRSLGSVLAADLNNVVTGVITGVGSGVGTAMAILHMNKGSGDGGGSDAGSPPPVDSS